MPTRAAEITEDLGPPLRRVVEAGPPLADERLDFDRDSASYEGNQPPGRLQADVRLVAGDPLAAAWRRNCSPRGVRPC